MVLTPGDAVRPSRALVHAPCCHQHFQQYKPWVRVVRVAGRSETRMIALFMRVGGAMSAFTNSIGVAELRKQQDHRQRKCTG